MKPDRLNIIMRLLIRFPSVNFVPSLTAVFVHFSKMCFENVRLKPDKDDPRIKTGIQNLPGDFTLIYLSKALILTD